MYYSAPLDAEELKPHGNSVIRTGNAIASPYQRAPAYVHHAYGSLSTTYSPARIETKLQNIQSDLAHESRKYATPNRLKYPRQESLKKLNMWSLDLPYESNSITRAEILHKACQSTGFLGNQRYDCFFKLSSFATERGGNFLMFYGHKAQAHTLASCLWPPKDQQPMFGTNVSWMVRNNFSVNSKQWLYSNNLFTTQSVDEGHDFGQSYAALVVIAHPHLVNQQGKSPHMPAMLGVHPDKSAQTWIEFLHSFCTLHESLAFTEKRKQVIVVCDDSKSIIAAIERAGFTYWPDRIHWDQAILRHLQTPEFRAKVANFRPQTQDDRNGQETDPNTISADLERIYSARSAPEFNFFWNEFSTQWHPIVRRYRT